MVDSTSDPARDALEVIATFLIGTEPLSATLRRVAEISVGAHPPARFAGITMLTEGQPRTAVFTDDTAPEIDAAQYDVGDGPCLDSFRQGVVNRIDDTDADKRWTAFAATAARHGIRSTISFPMIAAGERTGALNLYSTEVAGFAGTDEELGLALAGQAAILIANSQVYWDSQRLNESLREGMRSRSTIEQAKGLLMASSRCTPDEAFATLVRASQRENRKLRDIAAELVDRAQRPAS